MIHKVICPGCCHQFQVVSEHETALRNLVNKLEAIEESPEYKAIWPYLKNHGMCYAGPNYEDELIKAKVILSEL